jgi:MOSC domain-containing protein YiiM
MSGRIVSVRVGRVRVMPRPAWDQHPEREWTSGYRKDPVSGPVAVGTLGLAGDEQFSRDVHGGPDKAVLAYAAAHYPDWRTRLGIARFGPGAFGENLTLEGWDETTVCVGDRFRAGGALLQVSQPRGPCANIARFWDREDLTRIVTQDGRAGWYLRVLEPGAVADGDAFTRIESPHPEWPVTRVFRYYTRESRDRAGLAALAALEPLSGYLRERFGGWAAAPPA